MFLYGWIILVYLNIKKNERVWVKGIDFDLKFCDENDELEIWLCFWKWLLDVVISFW